MRIRTWKRVVRRSSYIDPRLSVPGIPCAAVNRNSYQYNSEVTKVSISAAPIRRLAPGLPGRLAILAAVFVAEKMFLNTLVDFARASTAGGVAAVLRVGQH